jgi:hypothetical protein
MSVVGAKTSIETPIAPSAADTETSIAVIGTDTTIATVDINTTTTTTSGEGAERTPTSPSVLGHETIANSDDAQLPQNLYNPNNYEINFPLLQNHEILNKIAINNNIIGNNELCFLKLKDLCELYFKHPKLMQLGNLKYGTTTAGIGDSSCFLCIGTRKAYDSILNIPFTRRINKNRCLFIEKSPDYKTLFVPFLNDFFNEDNLDILNETYESDKY